MTLQQAYNILKQYQQCWPKEITAALDFVLKYIKQDLANDL